MFLVLLEIKLNIKFNRVKVDLGDYREDCINNCVMFVFFYLNRMGFCVYYSKIFLLFLNIFFENFKVFKIK